MDITVGKDVEYAVVENGGKCVRIEPFAYQSAEISYDIWGYERIGKGKKVRNVVRFCPSEAGECRVGFFGKGGERIGGKEFCIVPSRRQAQLRVENGKGYEKDGKYFLPYGINMAFPEGYQDSNGQEFGQGNNVSFLGLKQYENWFRACAKNGVNLVRIWCGCQYFSPDKAELGEYDLLQFYKLDKIFALANRYKIRLKLTIERFRVFVADKSKLGACEGVAGNGGNIFQKYATYQGEVVTSKAWLEEEKCRALWVEKLKEYAKRYACDPALYAIEFWNEMNAYSVKNNDMGVINRWNEYMAERARVLFPNAVLLNSLGSLDCEEVLAYYEAFCFEKFDWLQFHTYLDQGAAYDGVRENPIEAVKNSVRVLAKKAAACKKPLYLAETGAVNDRHSGPFRYYLADNDGILFVDCVYAPLFLGCLGAGNIWHWDNRYVAAKNLYALYAPLTKAVQGVDFAREEFVPIDLSNEKFYCLVLKGKTQVLAFVRNKKYAWQNVLRDGKTVGYESGTIDFSGVLAKNVDFIPIWKDERDRVRFDGKILTVEKCKRGFLLKGCTAENSK